MGVWHRSQRCPVRADMPPLLCRGQTCAAESVSVLWGVLSIEQLSTVDCGAGAGIECSGAGPPALFPGQRCHGYRRCVPGRPCYAAAACARPSLAPCLSGIMFRRVHCRLSHPVQGHMALEEPQQHPPKRPTTASDSMARSCTPLPMRPWAMAQVSALSGLRSCERL